ncbi:hypothetical protein QLX67_11635 [Balneolaceae bacterium ANBcel3]|nr:hypothetical protein [Balneolaceae bacterium ANBcel3]
MQCTRTFSLIIHASPSIVFPLLCPERETEWIPGWKYEWIYSKTGFIHECCLFKTHEYDRETLWMVSEYDPALHTIVFIHFAHELLTARFSVSLFPEEHSSTRIEVEYVFTPLSEKGTMYIDTELSEARLQEDMNAMEHLLNAFIQESHA